MAASDFERLRNGLRTVRDDLPGLAGDLGIPLEQVAWRQRLVHNVLPALDFELPVVLAAICGGGSTGKSTLFNLLAGQALSRVGFRAGLTARVVLAGHPQVLSGPEVARGLLRRLPEAPRSWQAADDATRPGPPLYVAAPEVPRHLLLIDTPDFDTGEDGRLVNRERAEPVLRTAEVLIYLFTNVVYNNLANTQFMAEMVGGIGGRPTVLVYRISRAASDEEVLAHCRSVAQRLYAGAGGRDGWPPQVIGLYRMPESDAVAEGRSAPQLVPLGAMTAGRSLPDLLAGLDVAAIKRHVLAADLAAVRREAAADLERTRAAIQDAELYRQALAQVTTAHALEALRAFPATEAVALATRLFVETSPAHIRVLRGTARAIGAPLRGLAALGRQVARWSGRGAPETPAGDVRAELENDLLLAANDLRNRMMDDPLIVPLSGDAPLLRQTRAMTRAAGPDQAGLPMIESLGGGHYNVHLGVPPAVREQAAALLAQDWEQVSRTLRAGATDLAGLPAEIEDELRRSVRAFRGEMGAWQRIREAFFASLAALPPILGVTYTLLTADPVTGGGLWIHLEGILGLNDLWALVAIPATLGLSDHERKQLEAMITPVFRAWLAQRAGAVVQLYGQTVCRPVLAALEHLPRPDDLRLERVAAALRALEELS